MRLLFELTSSITLSFPLGWQLVYHYISNYYNPDLEKLIEP